MGLEDTLRTDIEGMLGTGWTERVGQVVPDPEDLRLGNDAVELDATILYADLVESTALVDGYKWWFAGEVYKSFLHCAAKIIKSNDGVIVSYDGDRIMAVYIGDYKDTKAATSALEINGAVNLVINPAFKEIHKATPSFQGVKHVVGIDNGTVYAARTGVRGDNDIVWIGKAANHAAKLCALRSGTYASWITADVYDNLEERGKYCSNHPTTNMWTRDYWGTMGRWVYKSGWHLYGY